MKYNLNLTRDYCSHWTVANALRELLANTIDEGGVIDIPTDMNKVLKLTTEGSFPIEAFMMGYSVKHVEHPIGQYGEGLKIALLVLLRENVTFVMKSNNVEFKFSFEVPDGFGTATLHLEVKETAQPVKGTLILVTNITKEQINELYIIHPADSLIPNSKGLYCQGLLVEKDFYVENATITYGINLNQPLKMNRDRTYMADKEAIIPILEANLDPAFFLDFSSSWHVGSIVAGLSDEFAQRVARAFVMKQNKPKSHWENKRILFSSFYTTRYITDEEYYVAPYWFYGSNVTKSPSDKAALSRLEIPENSQTYTNSSNKSKLSIAILKEVKAARTINDLVSSIVRYVPLNFSELTEVTDYLFDTWRPIFNIVDESIPEDAFEEIED